MAHTPGPYIATTDFASGVFWVETEDGLCIAEVFGGDQDERLSGGVCESNANLFATSPDLLGACKAIVRAENGNALDLWAAIDMAKEAIAKARANDDS